MFQKTSKDGPKTDHEILKQPIKSFCFDVTIWLFMPKLSLSQFNFILTSSLYFKGCPRKNAQFGLNLAEIIMIWMKCNSNSKDS